MCSKRLSPEFVIETSKGLFPLSEVSLTLFSSSR